MSNEGEETFNHPACEARWLFIDKLNSFWFNRLLTASTVMINLRKPILLDFCRLKNLCFGLIIFPLAAYCSGLPRIDIVSYTPSLIPSEGVPYKYALLKKNFDVHFYRNLYKYVESFAGDSPDLQKIIFFDYCQDPNTNKLPYFKTICFKWEAIKIAPSFYDFYYRVYTFDDDLVDNKKFFKFYYPVLQPMLPATPSFGEKQLCAIVASNWNAERVAMLDFFAKKPPNSLHIYGTGIPQKSTYAKMKKGNIPGFHSGKEKLNVLKNYKFCICFENTHTVPGYITEKIFDTFAAGCIPIYWGPANIQDYIPADCFIDYRKFNNNREMYRAITSMTEAEYGLYIKRIRRFLQSDKAFLFSQDFFEETLYKAAMD